MTPAQSFSSRTYFLFRFLFYFLSLSIMMGAVLYALNRSEYTAKVLKVKVDEMAVTQSQKQVVEATLMSSAQDLLHLADQVCLFGVAEERTPVPFDLLTQSLLSLSKRKGLYDQVRYLDESGMEVFCINYNAGKPTILHDKELQSQSDRYYCSEVSRLEQDEIYISPIDLNIKQGKIEEPLKPILRFGTPVFDKAGKRQGVALLNYLAVNIIAKIEEVQFGSLHCTMLLNNDGYWLYCQKRPDLEFGFMWEQKNDEVFKKHFPLAAAEIAQKSSGQFRNKEGLFTFETVYPLRENWKTGTPGNGALTVSGDNQSGAGEYRWKIVNYLSSADMETLGNQAGYWLLGLFAILLSLFALISCLLARAQLVHKKDELHILNLAHYDVLTALVNRSFFVELTERALAFSRRQQNKLAFLYIDLDHFKPINDKMGHDAGDMALAKVAKRILEAVRTTDIVSRIGGDEFVVILLDIHDKQQIIPIARKILDALSEPMEIKGTTCSISASIGISMFPRDGDEIDILVRHADAAMYAVKKSGRNAFNFWGDD